MRDFGKWDKCMRTFEVWNDFSANQMVRHICLGVAEHQILFSDGKYTRSGSGAMGQAIGAVSPAA